MEIMKICKGVVTLDLNNADIIQAVKVYKALGEPTRLKIVMLLLDAKDNTCASAIGGKLETVPGLTFPGSTLSHHLKQLTDCGLIEQRKSGTYVFYSLNLEIAKKYALFLLQ
jgi:DNA-binding transcriptional ArsR family regulator